MKTIKKEYMLFYNVKLFLLHTSIYAHLNEVVQQARIIMVIRSNWSFTFLITWLLPKVFSIIFMCSF